MCMQATERWIVFMMAGLCSTQHRLCCTFGPSYMNTFCVNKKQCDLFKSYKLMFISLLPSAQRQSAQNS